MSTNDLTAAPDEAPTVDAPAITPADTPAAPAAAPESELALAHACDVLIADDTGASRELLAAILRNFAGRLDVREARNGIDALTQWRQLHPRITLLDIDMPGMDGLTVLQHMRQARPNTFVAMISGASSMDHVRKALELGASGFVIKPYKPQRILDLFMKYRQQTGHDALAAAAAGG